MGFLIIDGHSIGYTAQQSSVLTYKGEQTQAIFYSIKSLLELKKQFPGYEPIWLWDGGTDWRKEVFPEYKANREENPDMVRMKEEFKKQKAMLGKILYAMGITQMVVGGYEADDVAGLLKKKLVGKNVVFVTSDKDWLQFVDDTHSWYDPKTESHVKKETFFLATEYNTVEQYVQAKALNGDKSDNIPGVGGIGPVASKLIMSLYGDVHKLKTVTVFQDFGRCKRAVESFATSSEGWETFQRNMQLMDLRNVPAPDPEKVKKIKGKFDKQRLIEYFEQVGFSSYILKIDALEKVFGK